MMLFTLFLFEWKHPFWANLVQKIKIISLSWNLVPTLIRTCRIEWWCSLFLFLIENKYFGQIWLQNSMVIFPFSFFGWKFSFWANLVQNVRIISWSWNLVSMLIRICRVQWWCPFFLFLIGNTLFRQICSKKSKLSV